jgi:hypothetical protein
MYIRELAQLVEYLTKSKLAAGSALAHLVQMRRQRGGASGRASCAVP